MVRIGRAFQGAEVTYKDLASSIKQLHKITQRLVEYPPPPP